MTALRMRARDFLNEDQLIAVRQRVTWKGIALIAHAWALILGSIAPAHGDQLILVQKVAGTHAKRGHDEVSRSGLSLSSTTRSLALSVPGGFVA